MAGQRPPGALDLLDQTINDVLIQTGKALRAQAKNGRRTGSLANIAKIHEANNSFNAILDNIEGDIIRAKATLRRDLEQLRAQKNAAAAAEQSAAAVVQQAPPAPMDIDTEDVPSVPVQIKAEPQPAVPANNPPTMMAPFPNMDIDSPTTAAAAPPASAGMPARATPIPTTRSPASRKENLTRSPQKTAKPAPTPGTKPLPTAAVDAIRKSSSPVVSKAAPSPVLVRSSASPALAKASVSQPPTPTAVPAPAPKAISLSSSSSSPSIITSPVMMKKTASASSAMKTKTAPKSTPPKTTVPLPASAQVLPTAPAPTPVAVPVSIPVPAPATTTTAAAAPVPAMDGSTADMSMDDFFDLTGPSASDEQDNSNLGYTDMQFTLVPSSGDAETHTAPQSAPEAQPLPQQPQQHPPPQPPVSVPPPQQSQQPMPETTQAQQLDDSDFDVEKFAADAAQNLMDTTFASGQAVTGRAQPGQQPQQQPQPQPQQQSQPPPPPQQQQNPAVPLQPNTQQQNDDLMLLVGDDGTVGANAGIDNGDDLFKFIDDPGDPLGEDPTTSFDELYMGGQDSVDIDDFFDNMA